MRRLLFMLVFLAGCVAPVESDTEEEIWVDDKAETPDYYYSDNGGNPDPCAPIYDVVILDGKEVVIEIPVECHPLDLPIFWWGPDDYYESEPMEDVVLPQQTQTQQTY